MSALPAAYPADSPSAARSATRAPARVNARARARRQPARPAPPRVPEDFFSKEAHDLLTNLLITRTERWQTDGAPPIYYYGRDSEPLWRVGQIFRELVRRKREMGAQEVLRLAMNTLHW